VTTIDRPVQVSQPAGQLSLSFYRGQQMSSKLESDVCYTVWRHLVKATEVSAGLVESNGKKRQPNAWWMD